MGRTGGARDRAARRKEGRGTRCFIIFIRRKTRHGKGYCGTITAEKKAEEGGTARSEEPVQSSKSGGLFQTGRETLGGKGAGGLVPGQTPSRPNHDQEGKAQSKVKNRKDSADEQETLEGRRKWRGEESDLWPEKGKE